MPAFRGIFMERDVIILETVIIVSTRNELLCLFSFETYKRENIFWEKIHLFLNRNFSRLFLIFPPPSLSLSPSSPSTLVKLPRLRFQEEIPPTFYKFENRRRSAVFAFRFRSSVYFWPAYIYLLCQNCSHEGKYVEYTRWSTKLGRNFRKRKEMDMVSFENIRLFVRNDSASLWLSETNWFIS